MESILGRVQKEFSTYPSATIASFSPPSISGLGMFGGFEYQLLDKGNRTPQELYDEAIKLIGAANKNPAFSMVYTSFTANLPQLLIDVDSAKAMAQGVPISEIYNALAAYFGKSYVNDFNKYGRVYRVYMQADAPFREKPADLDKIFVKNSYGTMVPLSAVVKVKNVVGPYSLTRFNMYPAITINGMARSGVSSGQAMNAMAELSEKHCLRIWVMPGQEVLCRNRNPADKSVRFLQCHWYSYTCSLLACMKAGCFLSQYF